MLIYIDTNLRGIYGSGYQGIVHQGRRTIKLDLAEFVNMDALSRNSSYIVLTWAAWSSSQNFLAWLTETWTQSWPTLKIKLNCQTFCKTYRQVSKGVRISEF